jgi:hypothetical protein
MGHTRGPTTRTAPPAGAMRPRRSSDEGATMLHDDDKMARRAEEDQLDRRLRAELTEGQWQMHERLLELNATALHEDEDLRLEELARHLPGVAPAIRVLAEHLIEQRAADVGSCCTAPVPGGRGRTA